MSLFVFFISLLIVAQHVLGNHVPIIRSWRLRDVTALCWYVPWLQGGCQDRLAGSVSMDGFVSCCDMNPSMDVLPANRSWQPPCSHGTYQHETITSRGRQLLMMSTWLPKTCWATSRREIKKYLCRAWRNFFPNQIHSLSRLILQLYNTWTLLTVFWHLTFLLIQCLCYQIQHIYHVQVN